MPKLSEAEVRQSLPGLPGWTIQNAKLHREYSFPDFVHAFGFMSTAALSFEKINHHPEWCNVYNRVTVDLTTHDAGGITRLDLELAQTLETIASKLQ